MTTSKHISTNQNNEKVLLVGDISKVFLDTNLENNNNCDICTSISQATEALKNNTYSVIAIVITGLQTKLNPSLKTLRDNSSSKIVLLAQMYEEPIAIRFMSSSYNDKPLVNDYMICPIASYHELLPACCDKNIQSPALPATSNGKSLQPVAEDSQCEILNTQNELSARIRHLEKLATEDDLTGLKNRRYIMEFTRQIIEYAKE